MNADDAMLMMFLDCPAYLDAEGAARCGLPAEVRYRYVVASRDGPLESAMIRCPSGHWFNAPVEYLTWTDGAVHGPGSAGGKAARPSRLTRAPAEPGSGTRPNCAPAYYLGRPASQWLAVASPCRSRTAPGRLTEAVTGRRTRDGSQPFR
jgi:hypothetical protein